MKLKLTPKLFLLVAFVLLVNLALVFVFGQIFVENLYLSDKKKELAVTFRRAQELYSPDSQEFGTWVTTLDNQNIRITLFSQKTQKVVYSTSARFVEFGSVYAVRGPYKNYVEVEAQYDTDHLKSLLGENEFIFSTQIALVGSSPVMMPLDEHQSKLYLMGAKADELIVLLETPLEPIQAAADLTVRYTLWAGLIALLIGSIIAFVLSSLMTKPIRQMTRVARSMAELDFSKRVVVTSTDEVGELGENVNRMAEVIQLYTAELRTANDQLVSDIDERLRAEQAQKQLVSNISHELKTPLALISGYAEGLREGMAEQPEVRDEYCDVILDESRRMTRLIHQLLRLAKLQSFVGTPQKERVELAGLAMEMLGGFHLSAQRKDVSLEYEFCQDAAVLADPDACEQVLRNYMLNALAHVNEGGTLRVSLCDTEEGHIRLEVFNTGSHVSPENADRLWDSFYRADQGRSRDGGEVGLGLSIVKAHMLRHAMPFGVYNTGDGVVFYAEWEKEGADTGSPPNDGPQGDLNP